VIVLSFFFTVPSTRRRDTVKWKIPRLYNALYPMISPLMPVTELVEPAIVTDTERVGRGMLKVAKTGYSEEGAGEPRHQPSGVTARAFYGGCPGRSRAPGACELATCLRAERRCLLGERLPRAARDQRD
jgi:hypothetical protein